MIPASPTGINQTADQSSPELVGGSALVGRTVPA